MYMKFINLGLFFCMNILLSFSIISCSSVDNFALKKEALEKYPIEKPFPDVNAGLIFPLLSGEIFPVSGKKIIRSQRLRLSSAPSFYRNPPVSSKYVSGAIVGRA